MTDLEQAAVDYVNAWTSWTGIAKVDRTTLIEAFIKLKALVDAQGQGDDHG